jgi:hypothetical protein
MKQTMQSMRKLMQKNNVDPRSERSEPVDIEDVNPDPMQLRFCSDGTLREMFQINVKQELKRARRIHPHRITNVHEGYALLCEELNKEFFDEVCKKEKHHDPIAMYKELVQIAVVAQRIAEDVLPV